MKKTIILFSVALIILSGFASATLQDDIDLSLTLFDRTGNPSDCIISTCDTPPNSLNYTKIGDVQFSGHYNQSGLGWELCCTDSFSDAREVHGAVPQDNFGFSTDGHMADVPNAISLGLVMETIGSRECVTRPAGACLADELDAFRMSDVVNAHMGSSTDPNRPSAHSYNTSLCCKTYELCWDSVDNDADGFIDCADPDCSGITYLDGSGNVVNPVYGDEPQMCTGSIYDTNGCSTGIQGVINPNCQGPDDFFGTEQYFHCSYGAYDTFNLTDSSGNILDDESQVGICCPKGQHSEYNDILNSWGCESNDECGIDFTKKCQFDFFINRPGWLAATEEVNIPNYCNTDNFVTHTPEELRPFWVGKSTGCCLIDKFGVTDYWYDEGNVEIFGYAE